MTEASSHEYQDQSVRAPLPRALKINEFEAVMRRQTIAGSRKVGDNPLPS